MLEGLWLRTGRQVYMDLYHFWSKVFAVAFGMGVVSGLVMAYQFGTNWSEFSRFAGGITGPLLTYEVLTAFFLEAGFLGVMLFGMQRVGPGLHFVSTLAVAVGTLISSTWILASNSCPIGTMVRLDLPDETLTRATLALPTARDLRTTTMRSFGKKDEAGTGFQSDAVYAAGLATKASFGVLAVWPSPLRGCSPSPSQTRRASVPSRPAPGNPLFR